MPSHCPFSTTIRPVESVMDYASVWLPETPANGTNEYADVFSQNEVDALVCNTSTVHPRNIPEASKYFISEGSDQHFSWGVSVSGLFMYPGLNPERVDPFYPTIYGSVTTTAEAEASLVDLDSCFSHTTSGGFMHYHSASTCIADKDSYEN
jgi:hypothetical protein